MSRGHQERLVHAALGRGYARRQHRLPLQEVPCLSDI